MMSWDTLQITTFTAVKMNKVEDGVNTLLTCLQTFLLLSHSFSTSILIFNLRRDLMSHLSFSFWRSCGLPSKDHLASSSPSPASHYLLLSCVFGGFLGGPDEPLPRPAFGSHLASFTRFSLTLRPSRPCLLLVWTEKIMAWVYLGDLLHTL